MQSYYHRLTLAWLPQCTGQQTGNRAKRGRGKPVLQDMKNNVAILLKRLRFERYGVKTGEKANTHNQHWLTNGLGILAFSLVFTISLERSRFSKIAILIFVPLWH